MSVLQKRYRVGTDRLAPPEQTLARILPHLEEARITRCADITGLDRIGIPVYCVVRPSGEVLQIANGKGAQHVNAKVSGLMEAIEHFHAETPEGAGRLVRASRSTLQKTEHSALAPDALGFFRSDVYFSDAFSIDWVLADELLSGGRAWLPASSVYLCTPMLYAFSANGLASGNHPVEATLHGLYELIERDTISRLFVNGRLAMDRSRCHCVDLDSVLEDEQLAPLVEKVRDAKMKLVLFEVDGAIPVNTFWAILLDDDAPGGMPMIQVGYGSHLSQTVAASRAITEAAQSRLTYIHGAREDLASRIRSQANGAHNQVYTYFDRFKGDVDWASFEDLSTESLDEDLRQVLSGIHSAGYGSVYRVDLTREPFDIPVVKVFVPGMVMNRALF